jgi:hypothetical protein
VAVTLANLRTEVLGELGLDLTAGGTDELRCDVWLNRGVRDVLRKTFCFQDQITATPGAVSEYAIAATVLDIVDLAVVGQQSDPERATPVQVRRYLRGNTTSTGTVQFYALAGSNMLLFYPALGAATVIDLLVVPAPTVMSSGSHDVTTSTYGGIPDDYTYLVELYAKAKLASYRDDQTSAQGQRYRDEYREGVAEARKELMRRGGHRLPRAQVGRRRLVAHDRSADVR